MALFSKTPSRILGVDIGTFSVKVVEISKKGKRAQLENYGEIPTESSSFFERIQGEKLTVSEKLTAEALKTLIKEAKIKSRDSFFALPEFACFFTTFSLPSMKEEEMPSAVQYQAKQHIPLPLSEVVLDWSVAGKGKDKEKEEIVLIAVPNETISQYKDIAKKTGLEIDALEAEPFGLVRSLVRRNDKMVILVDIGSTSTTVSVVEKGVLKIAHALNFSSSLINKSLVSSLDIKYNEAEEIKCDKGLKADGKEGQVMVESVDKLLSEIENVFLSYLKKEKSEIEKIIFTGGGSALPGLLEHTLEKTGIKAERRNPFQEMIYPSLLEKTFQEVGPSFSIAAGMALRGFEEE